MSASPTIVVLWLVGLAWGALAAAPLAVRARRRRVDVRLRPLQPTSRRAGAHASPDCSGACSPRCRRASSGGCWPAREPGTAPAATPPLSAPSCPSPSTCSAWPSAPAARPTWRSTWRRGGRRRGWRRGCRASQDACALGATFADALDDLAARAPPLRPLADALLASDRLGAPVGPALARLAAEQRAELRRHAEANARRVPVRLLFPLVFVVLPAFGLLTVIPTLLAGFSRI